jgi:hypothetical protein
MLRAGTLVISHSRFHVVVVVLVAVNAGRVCQRKEKQDFLGQVHSNFQIKLRGELLSSCLTSIGDGSLTALRVAIRVENELVEDGRQTATHDGSEPINLEI